MGTTNFNLTQKEEATNTMVNICVKRMRNDLGGGYQFEMRKGIAKWRLLSWTCTSD